MKPTVTKFVDHLISLVQKEMTAGQKETEKILSGTSDVLQQKGVAVLNLTAVDVKPGVENSLNLVLEVVSRTRKRIAIPQSKLRVGDVVALKEYNLYYEEDTPFRAGIIIDINKWCIMLCLRDTNEAISIVLSPNLIERCQIAKLSNDVSYQRVLNSLNQLKECIKKKNLSILAEVLLGLRKLSEPKIMEDLNFEDASLNEYQKEAIRFVLGSPEISLIHGLPDWKVSYSDRSNQTTCSEWELSVSMWSFPCFHNLAERYVKHDTNIARIEHPAKVSPSVVRWTLDVLCSGADVEKVSTIMQEELLKLSRKLRTIESISEQKEREEVSKTLKSLLKKKVTLRTIVVI